MPLHTLESIFEDPHLQAVGLFQWEDHPSEGRMRRVGVPSSWSGSQPVPGRPAPAPGQHSIEVLHADGYSDAQIEQLRTQGIVSEADTVPQGYCSSARHARTNIIDTYCRTQRGRVF